MKLSKTSPLAIREEVVRCGGTGKVASKFEPNLQRKEVEKVAKKTMTKSRVQKLLSDVPDDKRFWSCDGQLLRNISELETYLKSVSHDTFHYHVNESKNDFGNWVKDVMGDEQLAQALQKSKTQAQASRCVSERISELKLHIKTK